MSTEIIVDRIEGEFVVVEKDGDFYNLPLVLFVSPPEEGDIITLGVEKPKQQTAEAEARLERLKQRDCGSDTIDL